MSAALVEVMQADAPTLESLRAGLQPFAHKSLGSLRIGMDEVRAVLSAISTIQSLTTRIAELEAEVAEAELRGARLMQEATAENIRSRATTWPEDTVYLNLYTALLADAIRALDPSTIIARATLTETSDDR